jgi:hypothetical protein
MQIELIVTPDGRGETLEDNDPRFQRLPAPAATAI